MRNIEAITLFEERRRTVNRNTLKLLRKLRDGVSLKKIMNVLVLAKVIMIAFEIISVLFDDVYRPGASKQYNYLALSKCLDSQAI